MTDTPMTASEFRRRGHSYRNHEPHEFWHAMAAHVNNPETGLSRPAARDILGYLEGGRFDPMLEATSKVYRALDPDERREFWRRNPDLMEWTCVWNVAQDLMDWRTERPSDAPPPDPDVPGPDAVRPD